MNPKVLLLGSGELGKELTISLKRLGCFVVAVDHYANAPAMQVADDCIVLDMLDGAKLYHLSKKIQPDFIVPEIEAIRTEALLRLEEKGFNVIPNAKATHLTMNRDAIRNLAHELGLKTACFAYAESFSEVNQVSRLLSFPLVLKPVMSSSGKGQSVVHKKEQLNQAWKKALSCMRGDKKKVILEEYVEFDFEVTLLTVRQKKGPTLFVKPIGHRQERGDYQESWLPARVSPLVLKKMQKMAKKITGALGGVGLFGVEFFVKKGEVYFSELSPRPHDTGMVTLISQDLSEFDLHARAILGLPIPQIQYWSPSASAVILGSSSSKRISYSGLPEALKVRGTEIRIFGKPQVHQYRRMGVALARAKSVAQARQKATLSASKVQIHTN